MSSNTITLNPIFSPTQISGCQLWLDAADTSTIVLSGSSVTQWNDKSGNANNATTVGANPTYSSNRVNFNGSQALQTSFSSSVTPQSIFFIVSVSNAAAANTMLGVGTGARQFRIATTIQTVRQGVSNILTSGTSLSNNTLYMIAYTDDGSTLTHFLDGSTYASGATTTFNAGSQRLGGAAELLNGFMQEIIGFTTAVTTTQRQQIEGYLAWKWGLTGSLPSNHPYKNTPVYAINTIPRSLQNSIATSISASSLPLVFFRPTQISGCQVWIDAADAATITQSGGTVSTVADKSGNGYNLTGGTGFTYPNNTFNGTNYPSFYNVANTAGIRIGVNSGFTLSQPVTHFIVSQKVAGSSAFPYFFDGTTSRNWCYYSSGAQIAFGAGSSIVYNSPPTVLILNGVANGASSEIYANGTLVSSGNIGANAFGGLTLGNGVSSGADSPFNGHICEYVCFNRLLSITQRQQMEGYFAWKWGLQSLLASNHPYKNFPPGLAMPPVPLTRLMGSRVFTPTGSVMWLDAQDPNGNGIVPANGASITTWVDKSGSGNSATGGTSVTLNSTGINNYPALSFTAAPSYFNSTDLYSNRSFSVFILSRRQAANDVAQGLIGGTTSANNQNMIILFGGSTILRFAFYGNDLDATIPAYTGNTTTEPSFIYGFTYTPGTRIISVNGTVTARDANATNLTASVGERIGYWGNGPTTFAFNGFIGEILVYNAVPTQAFRQTVEGYLAWKWGLQGNLPANHPYKKWPPPPS